MKKIKNCNSLYILGILALLFIVFISISITMKESYVMNEINDKFIPNNIVSGSSNIPTYNIDMAVMYQRNTEYKGNDISLNTFKPGTQGMYEKCFNICLNDPSCNGIVTDFDKGNIDTTNRILNYNCWTKSRMNENNRTISVPSKPLYSTIFPR